MREKSSGYIHPSGGLLSTQFIQKLKQENIKEKYVRADTFAVPGGNPPTPSELEKKITDAWKTLLDKWFAVNLLIRKYDVSTARKKWIIPLLEALDYKPQYLKKDTVLSEEKKVKVPLSHRGGDWDHAPIIHTVAPGQDLDKKIANGRGVKSPHDSLQVYLNESTEDIWGVVTNGIVLRILRDYYHTYTKGYVEFDLEAIFEERSFSDFLALYRLVHPSRFIPDEEGIPPLEHFYKISLAAGEKIGDELRENVKKAIEALGYGFLTKELKDKMIKDPEECKAYYQEILHVIYRIMFLMFAEQRGMLPTRDSLYAEAYSITRLREKAEKTKRRDRHYDLWNGLLVTFDMIKKGVDDPESKITVFGYNGSLFDDGKIKQLKNLKCENTGILSAIRNLTYFESEKTQQRISYVDLGVEEIGSIYESLLDYTPKILDEDVVINGVLYTDGLFFLDPKGAARKSTGSYYTDPRLINELIYSALKPVLEDRLSGKESVKEKEEALLSIKVCDPACGSGAFLIAATNFLGKELAKIRTDTEYPPDKEERKARRDVLQHCIYGVDLNSMAVELAKVSLWINACVKDMPLNFLDHHIKWGNSLIGTTPELIEKGIPDEAFTAVTGDDKEFVKKIVKINRDQRKVRTLEEVEKELEERKYVIEFEELSDIEERKPDDVDRKREKYNSIVHSPGLRHRKMIANAWTAAFFWPLHSNDPHPPTEGILRVIKKDKTGESVDKQILQKAEELANEYKFFHWYLEFPDVFSGDNHGFDCVLGNPPWDKIQPEEKKFFVDILPEIAKTKIASERKKLIADLYHKDPVAYQHWIKYKSSIEATSKFIKQSHLFPLTSKGNLNTYRIFSELASDIINAYGREGLIVQSGLATDQTGKIFFVDKLSKGCIIKFLDFENRGNFFPDVHAQFRFALMTLGSRASTKDKSAIFGWLLLDMEEIMESERLIKLTLGDVFLFNPNSGTCPAFRSQKDLDINRIIYLSGQHIYINKEKRFGRIGFQGELFNMTRDSNKFIDFQNAEGGNYLALYEAKCIHQFDHRYAGQIDDDFVEYNDEMKINSCFFMTPRSVVQEKEVRIRASKQGIYHNWMCGFRSVSSSTNERTSIFAVFPFAAVGNSINLILGLKPLEVVYLVSNGNSFIFDYACRQKMSGMNLNIWIMQQLPIIPLDRYIPELSNLIIPRMVELTYTAWDLQPFAQDILREVGQETWNRWFVNVPIHTSSPPSDQAVAPAPFVWNEKHRAELRAELDSIYFHLYRISREMTSYIMETFPIVKRKDEEKYGEFRTKELILKYYDEYADKIEEVKK